MERCKQVLRFAAGLLLALAAAVLLLSGLLEICGTNAGLMQNAMLDTAPPEATGLAEEEYPGVTLMITRYLAGAVDEFQYIADDGYGRPMPLFNEREQLHMADCRALFVLDRTVLLGSAAALCVLLLFCLMKGRRAAALGCFCGCVLILLAVAGIAVWAVSDFDAVFVRFHLLAFTNDLWLMDPRTDLIIRLMPLNFFIRYAAGIGVCWLCGILMTWGVSGWLSFRGRRKQKMDQDRG